MEKLNYTEWRYLLYLVNGDFTKMQLNMNRFRHGDLAESIKDVEGFIEAVQRKIEANCYELSSKKA